MAKYISIDEIEEGMITAEAVVNHSGFTLIPSGAVLKEEHKKLFKIWNVEKVSIKSEENENCHEFSEEQKLLATEYLKEKMTWVPKNDIEKDIYNTAILKIIKDKFNIRKEV